jgi:hypothetical protein
MKEETAGHPGVVGGVDTHKDLHMAAVVDGHDRVLGSECFATTRHGYKQMLIWMRSFGELLRVGVECTGTYGAGLLRYLQHADVTVLEVTAPDRSDRRKRGKDDTLDAENAAHAAFAGVRTVTPRTRDGMIESLRVLKVCRKTAIAARRVALQLIHNTVVCAPDELRESLRTMTRMQLIRTLAAWRPGSLRLSKPYLRVSDHAQIPGASLSGTARRNCRPGRDDCGPGQRTRAGPGLAQFHWIRIGSAAAADSGRQQRATRVGGGICRPVRSQSRAGIVGKGHPASPESRRGSCGQQRVAHYCHRPAANRPAHKGVC